MIESERREVRQIEIRDALHQVAERVGTFVAIAGGVRRMAAAGGVEHDDECAPYCRTHSICTPLLGQIQRTTLPF